MKIVSVEIKPLFTMYRQDTIVKAITVQDLPVIMAIAVLASVFVVFANLVVDILYAVLDPRVRLY